MGGESKTRRSSPSNVMKPWMGSLISWNLLLTSLFDPSTSADALKLTQVEHACSEMSTLTLRKHLCQHSCLHSIQRHCRVLIGRTTAPTLYPTLGLLPSRPSSTEIIPSSNENAPDRASFPRRSSYEEFQNVTECDTFARPCRSAEAAGWLEFAAAAVTPSPVSSRAPRASRGR